MVLPALLTTDSCGAHVPKQLDEGPRWTHPSAGWANLNTDGSFVESSGTAGGGMVLQDEDDVIIFTA